jgi:hypothetical protein
MIVYAFELVNTAVKRLGQEDFGVKACQNYMMKTCFKKKRGGKEKRIYKKSTLKSFNQLHII